MIIVWHLGKTVLVTSLKDIVMGLFGIKGAIKKYPWGTEDYIKSLVGLKTQGVVAEYWLGTHYLGEAKDNSGVVLSERISHRLSFLLKVLSISTPLAIQCHPAVNQAKEGYRREELLSIPIENRNYMDENDKTEAAIALSDLTALYGFRSISEIKENFRYLVPLLFEKIKDCSSVKDIVVTIKEIADEDKKEIINQLRENTKTVVIPSSSILDMEELCALCLYLYPDDIWCVVPLLLNVVHIKPYESIFVKPGTVHAYCRGNCMEIMTSSDNMTRLGLTHRFKDEEEFIKIADFSEGMKEKIEGNNNGSGGYFYDYPSSTFSLLRYEKGKHLFPLRKDGILFVFDGRVEMESNGSKTLLKKGEAVYIPEDEEISVTVDGVAFFAYERPKY